MDIESEIRKIQERNRRVEADKAWETSLTRRILIAVMTYITIVIFLIVIYAPDPFLTAIVPTVAFMLSTLSLPFFKRLWLERVYR